MNSGQLPLFHAASGGREVPAPAVRGAGIEGAADRRRIADQLPRVRRYMLSGRWRTLPEIARNAGCSEASASARLRDLRKPAFGGYIVNRRKCGPATFEYQVLVAPVAPRRPTEIVAHL